MKTWFVLGVLVAVIGALAAACSGGSSDVAPSEYVAQEVVPPQDIPAFELVDDEGEPFHFGDTAGKVTLFYFGYTDCPDICPTTMVNWRDAKELLGEDADEVAFIMVTVDPENDTPEVLDRYLQLFDEDFVGLTGSRADLEAVWKSFGVHVQREEQPESATGHSISHSASTFALDRDGRLRLKFAFSSDPADVASDIRALLE